MAEAVKFGYIRMQMLFEQICHVVYIFDEVLVVLKFGC